MIILNLSVKDIALFAVPFQVQCQRWLAVTLQGVQRSWLSYVNLCKGLLQAWHVLLSSNTTRHFSLLDVAKRRVIPSVSHSKRKACRVHVNKRETHDPSLFLKVVEMEILLQRSSAVIFDYFQWNSFSVEQKECSLWVSACSERIKLII